MNNFKKEIDENDLLLAQHIQKINQKKRTQMQQDIDYLTFRKES